MVPVIIAKLAQAHLAAAIFTLFAAYYFFINAFYIAIFRRLIRVQMSLGQIIKSGIFALIMSVPFMPSLYSHSAHDTFSITLISLFALSNLVWQTLYFRHRYSMDISAFILPVAFSHLLSWSWIAYGNHNYYAKIAKWILAQ